MTGTHFRLTVLFEYKRIRLYWRGAFGSFAGRVVQLLDFAQVVWSLSATVDHPRVCLTCTHGSDAHFCAHESGLMEVPAVRARGTDCAIVPLASST